jgi:hypothetical protein
MSSARPACKRRSAARRPWTGSTSPSPTARCTASSDRTGRASQRRSGSCSGCCAGGRRHGLRPRSRSLARRDRVAPLHRLRAGRRRPVADPQWRRGHRPAREAARRHRRRPSPPPSWHASSSTRRRRGAPTPRGNRQKVALVAALASDAPLLILDEPTSGLDPLMEEVFQAELAELRAQGRTVLLSSHILSEVERACDRVSIVRSGRIVDSGSLADLRHLTPHPGCTPCCATRWRPADVAGVGRHPRHRPREQHRQRRFRRRRCRVAS